MNSNFIKISLSLPLLFLATTAFAELPSEVSKFVGKEGQFVSLYNGKETAESGGSCKIKIHEFDKNTVSIEAGTYFSITADLEGATRSVAGNKVVVYKLKDHGKRPGGSVCGDFVPLTSYTKTLEVSENVMVVRQKYRCGFFDKNDIMEVCDLRN